MRIRKIDKLPVMKVSVVFNHEVLSEEDEKCVALDAFASGEELPDKHKRLFSFEYYPHIAKAFFKELDTVTLMR